MRPASLVALASLALAACSSSSEGPRAGFASSSSPTEPSGFCSRTCIEEDVPQCLEKAKTFREEFLQANVDCGARVACIDAAMEKAGPTEAMKEYAAAFCERCGMPGAPLEACTDAFFEGDGPGAGMLQYTDARLTEVTGACEPSLAAIEPGLMAEPQCEIALSSCLTKAILEDAKAGTAICRVPVRR